MKWEIGAKPSWSSSLRFSAPIYLDSFEKLLSLCKLNKPYPLASPYRASKAAIARSFLFASIALESNIRFG
ncbi:MAG: hypothetical protein V7K41_25035 [Nostoc sp.]|uniref:hypothetical protein n=1 Tax=Nostoc sp. TaxID=1180 RepID=UPI002FF8C15D